MKTFKTLIIGLSASTLLFVGMFEAQLNIVPRYYRGTIENDVRMVQGQQAVENQSLNRNYALLRAALERRVERNMRAIRQHVTCVETPEDCSQSFQY